MKYARGMASVTTKSVSASQTTLEKTAPPLSGHHAERIASGEDCALKASVNAAPTMTDFATVENTAKACFAKLGFLWRKLPFFYQLKKVRKKFQNRSKNF